MTAAVTHTAFDCKCGEPDCGGGTAGDAPAKNAVVYVVADEKSVDAAQAAATDPESPQLAKPAYVFGAGVMPTALLGGILERARIREVRHPGDELCTRTALHPVAATAEFVRCRDLTCRFPGCDKPAQVCDLDHTVAYPVGPDTPVKPEVPVPLSPSSENVLERPGRLARPTTTRRNHHLDQPDRPHLHHLPRQPAPVPELCAPTATLWTGEPPTIEPTGDRGAMMPKRRHTRAHNTAKAKAAERRLNDAHVAERNKPPPF